MSFDSKKRRTILVQQIDVPKEELDSYRAAFDLFDIDKQGTISVKEVCKIMKNFGNPMPEEHVRALFNKIDTSGDGEIEFDEFVSLMKEMEMEDENMDGDEVSVEVLMKAFEAFDKDKKGKITMIEFNMIMTQLCPEFTEEEFSGFLKECRINENAEKIDYKKLITQWKDV